MTTSLKRDTRIFEVIAQGARSGIAEERNEVFKTAETWSRFWNLHAGPSLPLPMVDFQCEMVILVHLGQRNAAGYSVAVERVEGHGERIAVHYVEHKPGARCIAAQVITQPFQVIKMPKVEKELVFIKEVKIQEC